MIKHLCITTLLSMLATSEAIAKPAYLQCTHGRGQVSSQTNNLDPQTSINLQKIHETFDEINGLYHFSTTSTKNQLLPGAIYYQTPAADNRSDNNHECTTHVKINRLSGIGAFTYRCHADTFTEIGVCREYQPQF